jgi:general stress protein CsbA
VDLTTLIFTLTKIVIGAFATFLAIVLWSKSRDSAWILVIVSVILSYAAIIFSTLEAFGIISLNNLSDFAQDLTRSLLENLPILLLAFSFLIVIRRRS